MPKFIENKFKNALKNKDKTFNTIKGIKSIKKRFGVGIALNGNEIKDIMEVIKFLENRGISSEEIPTKGTSQEGEFLNFLRILIKADLPLMKSVFTPIAKNVLLAFRLLAGMPEADTAIQKKIYGSGATTLVISNDEIKDIIKIVNSLEESELWIKRISETIKKKAKEQNGGFLFFQCYSENYPLVY